MQFPAARHEIESISGVVSLVEPANTRHFNCGPPGSADLPGYKRFTVGEVPSWLRSV
jgi:hypothetical protein